MKLRIVSAGTGSETKVTTEAGEIIENIIEIKWSVHAGAAAVAIIELVDVEVDIVHEVIGYMFTDATGLGDKYGKKRLVRKEIEA